MAQRNTSVRLAALVGVALPLMLTSGAAAQTTAEGEIVVTAVRRDTALNETPLSIAAFGQDQMDELGVREFSDIAALTPGLTFTRGSWWSSSNTQVAIRGIQQRVGDSTTAVYIDDAPVQVRGIGNSATNPFPVVFDLERIEVLRGPQGTLFGAGAEGGAVRFITPQPSLEDYSGYARAELAFTEGGAPSFESGVAYGGPIIEGALGFRASVWYRQDGGWVDRASYPDGAILDENANTQDSIVAKAALTWAPNSNLTITPAIFFQQINIADTQGFWTSMSDLDGGSFKTGYVMPQPVEDYFILPSLNVDYDFGSIALHSITSYFFRRQEQTRDYTNFDSEAFGGAGPYVTMLGQNAPTYQWNGQENLTQELRLQSDDPSARLQWVLGGYYSVARQTAAQVDVDAFLEQMILDRTGGALDLEDWFGAPALPGDVVFESAFRTRTIQTALFGQLDFAVTDQLTFTLGVRASDVTVEFRQQFDGPLNGGFTYGEGESSETAVVPKVGVSYVLSEGNMLYASYAEGFRPGGAQIPVPATVCGADLAAIGLTETPLSYESDNVASYEIGTKNRLFNGRLSVDASAYHIDWSNLQNAVYLSGCGYGFTMNGGSATSEGFDLSLLFRPTEALTLGLDIGYTDVTYDQDIGGGGLLLLAEAGDKAFGGPPLTINLSAEYEFVALGQDAFVRLNYQYADGTPYGPTGTDNPSSILYDPAVAGDPETHWVSLRGGVRIGGAEITAFVNNLFDEAPLLGNYRLLYGSPLFTATTFRPRTIGVTTSVRF